MLAVLRVVLRAEQIVAAVAYAIVAGLLLGEVIAREVFSEAIWGSQKMAVFAAIYAGFIGLTLATSANGHLRPQFTDGWWPDGLQSLANRLGDLLSVILFAGFGYIATLYVIETFQNNDLAAVLYTPLWPIQIIIPYAFYSSAVRHLAFAIWPDSKPQPEILDLE